MADEQTPVTPPEAGAPPEQESLTPEDWKSLVGFLPEDVKKDGQKYLEQFKDFPSFAKSAIESAKVVGSSFRIPKDDAPEEEKTKILDDAYHKFGWPENIEGYEFKPPELPQNMEWDNDMGTAVLTAAYEKRVTKDQLQGIINAYVKLQTERNDKEQEIVNTWKQQIKDELGGAYPRYMELSDRLLRQFGSPELDMVLEQSGLKEHPATRQFLMRLVDVISEHEAFKTEQGAVQGGVEEAKRKIAEIYSNPEHPFHRKFAGTPAHTGAVAEMQRLYEIAYGTAPVAEPPR